MERIMLENYQNIGSHIGMLLRDQPVGRTADLLDYTVAYWDGHQVVGMHLCADETGPLDEEFELTDDFLAQIPDALADWIQNPHYTFHPELIEWLKDAPPYDACV